MTCEHDKLRLACPTCGGTKEIKKPIPITPQDYDPRSEIIFDVPCPDCTDGRMSHERAWKIVAAVENIDALTAWFENELTYDAFRDKADTELATMLCDHLRGIR